MSIQRIIKKHYKYTNNPNPIWRAERKVMTIVYEFDCVDLETWESLGKTNLYWKYDTNDKVEHPLYHGCSWRFGGYNPTPVTDWFHGLPRNQMLDWCGGHGLHHMKVVGRYTDIYYHDICKFDDYNCEYYNPETGEVVS